MSHEALIEAIGLDIELIVDPGLKAIVGRLLNVIEAQAGTIKAQHLEIGRLSDEVKRLKGEHGRPFIRKQGKGGAGDISSEAERKVRTAKPARESKAKKHKITINRVERCHLDRAALPSDAVYKGPHSVVIQELKITTDNVEFLRDTYYSPSQNKTYIAPLPAGYFGEFGPHIRTLIIDFHNNLNMTESAIELFLTNHGIVISAATISRILTDNHEEFHEEKRAVVAAGLASCSFQQMDDTGARVHGKNHVVHILCNPLFTAYFTRKRKDRLTILEILTQGSLRFQCNESAYALMEILNLPAKRCEQLRLVAPEGEMTQGEMDLLLDGLFPNPKKHQTNRRIMLEAAAITAYRQLPHAVQLLLCDDAPQFKQITQLLALCWVHDGRHYKKLDPVIPKYRKMLDEFLDKYWEYYRRLLDYKDCPSAEKATALSAEFDQLFATKTGYDALDQRITKTQKKKDSLLLVLEHPQIPLHNNASELGARAQARKRDISFHTINTKGSEAKDTFMTLIQTAKKLGVNSYRYIYDRISKTYALPSLDTLIIDHAQSIS
jgi:hypothetical protein